MEGGRERGRKRGRERDRGKERGKGRDQGIKFVKGLHLLNVRASSLTPSFPPSLPPSLLHPSLTFSPSLSRRCDEQMLSLPCQGPDVLVFEEWDIIQGEAPSKIKATQRLVGCWNRDQVQVLDRSLPSKAKDGHIFYGCSMKAVHDEVNPNDDRSNREDHR